MVVRGSAPPKGRWIRRLIQGRQLLLELLVYHQWKVIEISGTVATYIATVNRLVPQISGTFSPVKGHSFLIKIVT
jgi:hypothetical protein